MTWRPPIHQLRARAVHTALGGVLSVAVGGVVWFAGFDGFWAAATALAVIPVGALLVSLGSGDDVIWEPPRPPAARGALLVITSMERALAACDRLARPHAVRRMRATMISEHDDHVDRSVVTRRMRALLVAELRHHRLDPTDRSHDARVIALFGPEALAILKPSDDTPMTTALIARCLDAIALRGPATSART